jgi:hypothetical protein
MKPLKDDKLRVRTSDVLYLYFAVKNYMKDTEYQLAQVKSDSEIGVILEGHMSQGRHLLKLLNKKFEKDVESTTIIRELNYWKHLRNNHKRRNR